MLALTPSARGAWQPQVLDTAQCGTLAAIGERIVPGSAAAQCDRVIDLVLSLEPAGVRDQLLHSVAAFDMAARDRYGKPFASGSPEQQDAVVAAMANQTDKDSPFSVIKEWVADTYWSSREGLHELGWKGQLAWTHAQVCESKT